MKTYTLKATKQELKTTGYSEVLVWFYKEDSRLTLWDNDGGVLLTPSQVRKLRKIIDKHYPIASSAYE